MGNLDKYGAAFDRRQAVWAAVVGFHLHHNPARTDPEKAGEQ